MPLHWILCRRVGGACNGLPTRRTPARRTITYNTGGGTLPGYTQRDYLVGSYTHLPAMSQKYKVFGGWYLDAGYKTAVTALGAKDLGNVTVYAKWRPACIVHFDPAGGTGATLPKPNRKGYTFVGWYTDSKCTKKVSRLQPWYAGKKTLYAKWKK